MSDVLEKTPFAKGDETKLPKWVQSELMSLRSRIKELEGQLAIANRNAPSYGATGKVIADDLGGDGFPLRDRAQVTFTIDSKKHHKIACMLRGSGSDLALDVNSHWGPLIVHPVAGNVIRVTVGER